MRTVEPALGKALALSLLLHALVLYAGGWLEESERGAAAMLEPQLEVTLRARAAPAESLPPIFVDESLLLAARPPASIRPARVPTADVGRAAARSAYAADPRPALAGEAARQADAHMNRELLYPLEAIARGLEGQVLVRLFLDAAGNAIAARLEASSGYALLDDAAVRAARTLRALPEGTPREALLPVRFRLR